MLCSWVRCLCHWRTLRARTWQRGLQSEEGPAAKRALNMRPTESTSRPTRVSHPSLLGTRCAKAVLLLHGMLEHWYLIAPHALNQFCMLPRSSRWQRASEIDALSVMAARGGCSCCHWHATLYEVRAAIAG